MKTISYRPTAYIKTFKFGDTLYESSNSKIIAAVQSKNEKEKPKLRAVKIIKIDPN